MLRSHLLKSLSLQVKCISSGAVCTYSACRYSIGRSSISCEKVWVPDDVIEVVSTAPFRESFAIVRKEQLFICNNMTHTIWCGNFLINSLPASTICSKYALRVERFSFSALRKSARNSLAVHACVCACYGRVFNNIPSELQFGVARHPHTFEACTVPVSVGNGMVCKGKLPNSKHKKCTTIPSKIPMNTSVDGGATLKFLFGGEQLSPPPMPVQVGRVEED